VSRTLPRTRVEQGLGWVVVRVEQGLGLCVCRCLLLLLLGRFSQLDKPLFLKTT